MAQPPTHPIAIKPQITKHSRYPLANVQTQATYKVEFLRIINIMYQMIEHRRDPLYIRAPFRDLMDYLIECYKTNPFYGRNTIITSLHELAGMLNVHPAMKHKPLLHALKMVYCSIGNYTNIGHLSCPGIRGDIATRAVVAYIRGMDSEINVVGR